MGVVVDKARQYQLAASIYAGRFQAGQLLYFFVCAHRDDALAAHRQGLGPRLLRLARPYAGVIEQPVCCVCHESSSFFLLTLLLPPPAAGGPKAPAARPRIPAKAICTPSRPGAAPPALGSVLLSFLPATALELAIRLDLGASF